MNTKLLKILKEIIIPSLKNDKQVNSIDNVFLENETYQLDI